MSNSSKKGASYWFSSVFFALAQRLSIMLAGIGTFLILVRALSKEDMGVYALFFTVITAFEVTRDGLVKNATIRFINLYPKERNGEIQGAALMLSLGYTLLFIGSVWLGAEPLSRYWEAPQLAEMLYIYCVTASISIFFSHTEYIQQANFYFKGIFLIYFTKQGLYFLFVAGVVFFVKGTSLPQLALLQTVSVLMATIVGYISARRYLADGLRIRFAWFSDLWRYGRFVLATNISSQTLRTVDHFLLASLVSTPAVAIYNTSVRISNLLDMPSKAVAEALFPKSVQSSAGDRKGVAKLYEQTTGGVLAVLAPMCLFIFLFPELIIRIIAGEKYLEAVPVLRVAVVYSLLLPFQKQFGTVMDAAGKPNINFLVNLVLALFNLACVYILVNAFGLIGAAFGLLTTLFVAFIISQTLLKREFGVSTIGVFKQSWGFYKHVFSQKLFKQMIAKVMK